VEVRLDFLIHAVQKEKRQPGTIPFELIRKAAVAIKCPLPDNQSPVCGAVIQNA
jgi:hypothetical protein